MCLVGVFGWWFDLLVGCVIALLGGFGFGGACIIFIVIVACVWVVLI